MKKFFIKIDLNSIEKNKNAGNTVTRFSRRSYITFQCDQLPNDFILPEGCYIMQHTIGKNKMTDIIGHLDFYNESTISSFPKDSHLTIKIEIPICEMIQPPEQKFFFEYENTELVCSNCKQKIMSYDLDNDYDFSDSYSDTICPLCHCFDCCEIKYEIIEDALKRMKNNEDEKQ